MVRGPKGARCHVGLKAFKPRCSEDARQDHTSWFGRHGGPSPGGGEGGIRLPQNAAMA